MKIHIITLHSIYNPGSALQAFGLQRFLESSGYDTEIIDYRPSYSTVGRNKLKGYLRKIIFYKNEAKIKSKYEGFINDEMKLSSRAFKSLEQLEKSYDCGDIFISGSDQLWNSDYDCGRDQAYYLGFTGSKNKMSYATSVGKKQISDDEINKIVENIKSYSIVSVREKSTAETLKKKLGKEVFWVCDPVFLLNRKEYQRMTRDIDKENYALVYLSPESTMLDSVIKDIKEKTGYKVILIGGNRTRCECDEHIKDLGPYDFLSMIKNSKLVISSSFHATAFSHIFHKKFGVILPKANGERIESLLNLTGLSSHIIKTFDDISSIYDDIDYSVVDMLLGNFIEESKRILLDGIAELASNEL